MVEYTLTKVCNACKQEKSVTEFYARGKGYLCSECKACMKERYKVRKYPDKKIAVVESERLVIEELHKHGISALPGKALHQQWADVVAWGCVLIEVKSSTMNGDNQFHFTFSVAQQTKRLRGELIVLMCMWENQNTFHVFPVNHPMFYNNKGKLKTAVTWRPDRGNAGRPTITTDELMAAAKDNWQLVESVRQKVVTQLLNQAAA